MRAWRSEGWRIPWRPELHGWRDLLRDRQRPWRTAVGAGLGAWIGGMPLLGVHTWVAAGVGATAPLPPLAVLVGSNVSNPLTFLPLTWLEIRVGQALLGRPGGLNYEGLTLGRIGEYWIEAWVGFVLVGPAMAVVTLVAVRGLMAARARRAAMRSA